MRPALLLALALAAILVAPPAARAQGGAASTAAQFPNDVHTKAGMTCASCHGTTTPGAVSAANVCAECHVREADLFKTSPKQKIFDDLGQPACLACHPNHEITPPQDTWVGLQDGAVCAQCHDATTPGSTTILAMRRQFDELATATASADVMLTRAERAGMLVDDGRRVLREAREHQVHARALLHGFSATPVADAGAQGTAASRRALEAGEAAMRELQVRRRGLGLATLVILAFLVVLAAKIRHLPPHP